MSRNLEKAHETPEKTQNFFFLTPTCPRHKDWLVKMANYLFSKSGVESPQVRSFQAVRHNLFIFV